MKKEVEYDTDDIDFDFDIEIEVKTCTRCDKEKPCDKFPNKKRTCRDCQNEMCRNYKRRNKEKISEYNKKYKSAFAEDISEYNHNYSKNNRATIQKRHTAYLKNRRNTNPEYKMACMIRKRIYTAFNSQNTNTDRHTSQDLLGCDYTFLKEWLESQFIKEMTYENHGKVWHIDHVIPCARFDLSNEEEQYRCANWTNLQPKLAIDNLSKGDIFDKAEIKRQIKKVNKYITLNNLEKSEYMICEYNIQQYNN